MRTGSDVELDEACTYSEIVTILFSCAYSLANLHLLILSSSASYSFSSKLPLKNKKILINKDEKALTVDSLAKGLGHLIDQFR